jgi:hypothetical protein
MINMLGIILTSTILFYLTSISTLVADRRNYTAIDGVSVYLFVLSMLIVNVMFSSIEA